MKAHSEDGFSCRHAVVVEQISCDADTNRKDAAYKTEWQCSTICQKLWCIPGRIYRRFEEKREALRGPRKARHSTSSRGKNSSRSLPLTKKIRSFCRRRRQRAKMLKSKCSNAHNMFGPEISQADRKSRNFPAPGLVCRTVSQDKI